MRWLRRVGGVFPGGRAILWCGLAAAVLAGNADPTLSQDLVDDVAAQRPLHEVVDGILSRASRVVHGTLAGDAEFLRRLSLDLVGMPPTADEVRAFLRDDRPDKRERAVDRSLNDPRFARHLATVLSVMLLERRTSKYINEDEWDSYLLQSVQRNRAINEIICEILAADGTDDATRAAAQFYIAREADPHLITRDVGRIIFGRDMECAQCHDHPNVADYLQRDYHGLLAVFAKGTLHTKKVDEKEIAFYGEGVGKDDIYESVFIDGQHLTGARLPGAVTLEEPILLPGEDEQVRPDHADVPKPVLSRREMLAKAATDGTNRAFNENLANRLWAHMMGRGLVHPVDLHHSANPPTHPELMRVLGERLAAMGFNARTFLRELALTRAYQATIDPPEPSEGIAALAETLQDSLAVKEQASKVQYDASAIEYETALAEFEDAEARLLPAAEDFAAKRPVMRSAMHKLRDAQRASNEADQKLAARSEALAAVQEAREKAAIAVEKLAGDEALASAANTFTQRAEALSSEVEAIQKSAEEKRAALDPIVAEKETAAKAAEAAARALAPLREETRKLEATMVAARGRMMDDFAEFWRLHQRREHADEVLVWNVSRRRWEELAKEAANQNTMLDEHQAACDACRQTVEARTADLARISREVDAARTSYREIEKRVALIDEQSAKLAAALAKVHEVMERLESDESLAAAAEQIEATIADLAAHSAQAAERIQAAQATVDDAEKRLAVAQREVDEATAEFATTEEAAASARSTVEQSQAQAEELAAKMDEAWQKLTEDWATEGAIRPLVHLSPEQLCWGMLHATGVYDQTWRQQAAELDKEQPQGENAPVSPFVILTRRRTIEERTYEKLKGNVRQFVRVYGVGAGQPQAEFFASAEQALFVSNGSAVNNWTAPRGDNVTARMLKAEAPVEVAEELYLGVLNRFPTEDEAAAVAAYMDERPDDQRQAAARELAWGLLTSAEFRFNH